VDPSSPFTHGALLGDRIRMQDLTSDRDVFLRSMATRGSLGGLAASTAQVVAVLDAAGKDMVFVETVGAGQDEVEIADTAHTTVVISIPGAGDDMQAIKAGILEIADILVVNKADLPLAEAVYKQLHIFMELDRSEGWRVPILKTVATKGQGVTELVEEIDKHRQYLTRSGRLAEMRRHRARRQLLALVVQHHLRLVRTRPVVAARARGERLLPRLRSLCRGEERPHPAPRLRPDRRDGVRPRRLPRQREEVKRPSVAASSGPDGTRPGRNGTRPAASRTIAAS